MGTMQMNFSIEPTALRLRVGHVQITILSTKRLPLKNVIFTTPKLFTTSKFEVGRRLAFVELPYTFPVL